MSLGRDFDWTAIDAAASEVMQQPVNPMQQQQAAAQQQQQQLDQQAQQQAQLAEQKKRAAIEQAASEVLKQPAQQQQPQGWGMMDTLKTGVRSTAESLGNMLPFVNQMVLTDTELAPRPQERKMFGVDMTKGADLASDLASGFGAGAIGAVAGGPGGMGVAGFADQLGRNFEDKRIDAVREMMQADPSRSKFDADFEARQKLGLDAGDLGDAGLAGVINMLGGKVAEKSLTTAAKNVFGGSGTVKEMLKAAVPQVGFDAVTGGLQGISSVLNKENVDGLDDIKRLATDKNFWKNVGTEALVGAAISAGGQAATAKGDLQTIRDAKTAGVETRAHNQRVDEAQQQAESARKFASDEAIRSGASAQDAERAGRDAFMGEMDRTGQTWAVKRPEEYQPPARQRMLQAPKMPDMSMDRLSGMASNVKQRATDLAGKVPTLQGDQLASAMGRARDIIGEGAGRASNAFKATVSKGAEKLREFGNQPAAEGTPAVDPAAQGAPAKREVIQRPDGSIERVRGGENLYAHPKETIERNPHTVRYELRELDDIKPSHLPESGFQNNPDYPEQIQNRFYDSDIKEQEKVQTFARDLAPSKLISKTYGADSGPPILDSEGNALAGNGRTQVLRLARATNPEGYKQYREALKQQAADYGFDPADIDAMKDPVLVRAVDIGDDPDYKKRALFGAHANDRESQAQPSSDVGVTLATSGKIPEELVKNLMDSVDGDKLGQALSDQRFLFAFKEAADQAIPRESGAMFNPKGELNEHGRAVVKSMLFHSVMGDRNLGKYLTTQETGVGRMVESALMPLQESKSRENDFGQIIPDLRVALRMVSENPSAKTADDVIAGATGDMVNNLDAEGKAAGLNERQKQLIRVLKSKKPTALREVLKRFEPLAADQDGMFADPDMDPGVALKPIVDEVLAKPEAKAEAPEAAAPPATGEVIAEPAAKPYGSAEAVERDPNNATDTMFDRDPGMAAPTPEGPGDFSKFGKATTYGLAQRFNDLVKQAVPADPKAAKTHNQRVADLQKELDNRGVEVDETGVAEPELQRLLETPELPEKAPFERPPEGFDSDEPGSASAKTGTPGRGLKDVEAQPLEQPEIIQLFKDLVGEVPAVKPMAEGTKGFVSGLAHQGVRENIRVFINATNAGDFKHASRVLAHELFHIVDWIGGHADTLKRGGLARRLMSDSKTIKQAVQNLHRQPVGFKMRYKWARTDPSLNQKKVREELVALSKAMRPYDEKKLSKQDLAYRLSGKELYADFGSALIMNPKLAQEMAPVTFKGFFKYLDEKPDVKKAYESMVDLVGKGPESVNQARLKRTGEMFDRAKEKRTDVTEKIEKDREGRKGVAATAARVVHDKAADVMWFVEDTLGMKRFGSEWSKLKNAKDLSEGWDNDVPLMMLDLEDQVHKPLKQAGVSAEDLGKVMMYQHIQETRFKTNVLTGELERIYNPQGLTVEAATDLLDQMKKDLGQAKYDAVVAASDKARTIVFDAAVQKAYDSGIIGHDQYKRYFDRKDSYARFSVVKFIDERIGADMKQQVGTFQDIENPYGATVLQGAALIRWANQNNFKRALAEQSLKGGLPAAQKDTVIRTTEEGEKKQQTVFRNPKPGEGKLLEYWTGGKKEAVILPTHVVDAMHSEPHAAIQALIGGTAFLNKPFKMAFTKYSPVFNFWSSWMRDLPETAMGLKVFYGIRNRDFFTETMRQLKGDTPLLKFLAQMATLQTGKVKSNAADHVLNRNTNPVVRKALEDSVLIPMHDSLMWNDGTVSASRDVDRRFAIDNDMIEGKGLTPRERMAQRVKGLRMVKHVIDAMQKLPQVGEMIHTAQKLAADNLLKEAGITDAERLAWVRTFAGNPNTKQKGAATSAMDQVYFYTNVIQKSAYRNLEMVKRNPKEFAKEQMKYGLIGSAAKLAARAGLMGGLMQAWIEGISEFDRSNYQLIPVPPFVSRDEHGRMQSHYIRAPMNDPTRFSHGLMWKMGSALIKAAKDDPTAADEFLSIFAMGESFTPGLSPLLKISGGAFDYAMGKNPYDEFRQRHAIDPDVFDAGGWRKHKAMLGWMVSQTGATNFMKFNGGAPSFGGFDRFYRVSGKGWDEMEYQATGEFRKENSAKRAASDEVWDEYLETADPAVVDRAQSDNVITEKQAAALRDKIEKSPLERKMHGLNKDQQAKVKKRFGLSS